MDLSSVISTFKSPIYLEIAKIVIMQDDTHRACLMFVRHDGSKAFISTTFN